MRKTALVFAALAATATAAPALAQDSDNMTGVRVAVVTGIDAVDIEGTEEGLLYGISAGYDFDLGGAVLGLEAELTDSTVSASGTDLLVAGDRLEIDAERDIYVGVRLGAPLGGGGLVYAKAGYVNGRLGTEYDDGTTTVSFGDNQEGYRLGVGAEFPLNDSVFVRGEYRYSDYGELEVGGTAAGVDVSRHQGVIGLGVKF
jgi:outer membrane immunogenic protein